MRITADTNLLVRALVHDDLKQARIAERELEQATSVVFTLPALCELVWVLARVYSYRNSEIAEAIRVLTASDTAIVDRGAVDEGLAILDAGGDFADGIIAHVGSKAGSEVFVTFDKQAVKRMAALGRSARLAR